MTTLNSGGSMSPEEQELFVEKMMTDEAFRGEATKNLYWFSKAYFPNSCTYEFADFHKEIMQLLEDEKQKRMVIAAFRGSGKSTIVTMIYVLYEILKRDKKYIVIVGRTQNQVRLQFDNIKRILEDPDGYPLLRKDLGPFREESDEWRQGSIVLEKYNAKITGVSVDQGIRGMRYLQYRPQVFIVDDLEDQDSVATKESRNKMFDKVERDIIPAGDMATRTIIVGTILHDDSVFSRYEKAITSGQIDGVFKKYPIVDEAGRILWPAKYDNEKLEAEKKKYGSQAWNFEFMLKVISPEDRVIMPEWIEGNLYDELPPKEEIAYAITGLDSAISMKETADYTALVSAYVTNSGHVYILPNAINKRMNFPDALKSIEERSRLLGNGHPTKVVAEKVAFQETFVQQLRTKNIPIEGVDIMSMDKRERLSVVAPLFENGNVHFPRNGAEQLKDQIIYFGRMDHDDMTDATTIALLYVSRRPSYISQGTPAPSHGPKDENEADRICMLESEYERSGHDPRIGAELWRLKGMG